MEGTLPFFLGTRYCHYASGSSGRWNGAVRRTDEGRSVEQQVGGLQKQNKGPEQAHDASAYENGGPASARQGINLDRVSCRQWIALHHERRERNTQNRQHDCNDAQSQGVGHSRL